MSTSIIKKLAAHFDVAPSTISRALRDRPGVSNALKLNIQAKAKEMGYQPDPIKSSFARYVRNADRPEHFETIAWINHRNEKDFWHAFWISDILKEAVRHAQGLGFHLEEFWMGPYNRRLSGKRLSNIFKARGIQALLIPPIVETQYPWALQWESFTAVSIGRNPLEPDMYCVETNDYLNMKLCYSKLVEAGHQRIGFAHYQPPRKKMEDASLAAFLEMQFIAGAKQKQVPPFIDTEYNRRHLRHWLRTNRPDAVITESTEFIPDLKANGIPYCLLVITQDNTHASGIDQRGTTLAIMCVETLLTHLIQNRRGLSKDGECVMIPGKWLNRETHKKKT